MKLACHENDIVSINLIIKMIYYNVNFEKRDFISFLSHSTMMHITETSSPEM